MVMIHECKVEGISAESAEGVHILRHSCAHLLAQAVTSIFPDAKPTIGPAIESGFYYDFAMDSIGDEELRLIEKKMTELTRANLPVERIECSDDDLQKLFAKNPFKLEIISDKLEDGDGSTIYKQGDWYDLCLGPHVPSTSKLMYFKLTNISSAYWRADSSREQLVRIYGMVYPTKELLKQRIRQLEEAKSRDHRKLGRDLQLFHIDDMVGQGLILWKPYGAVIRNQLQNFIETELTRQDYVQVFTPHIAKLDLYRASGHFPYYRESQYPPMIDHDYMQMLASEDCDCSELSNRIQDGSIEGYLLKPMNCPHHIKIYSSESRSYRDLPLRFAEFGTVYRWEQSGEISGMTRVRGFTQDDAHLFVTEDQIAQEIQGCLELVKIIFETLGMDNYRVRVGLRDQDSTKYVGDSKKWDKAEDACRRAAESLDVPFIEEPGEAAFYGPKIDFVVKDILEREWQLGTIQVDYNLPERFDLTFQGSDGEGHRPVMIHRAPFGSMERFCGVLIEHFAGRFPTWLSPIQVQIITISEKHAEYGESIASTLKKSGIRVNADLSDATIGKKIRTHRKMYPPYMLIIGDEEINNNAVSIRYRSGEQVKGIALEDFINSIVKEIENKNLTCQIFTNDNT